MALHGMGGGDRLTGGAYADRLEGGNGDDVLTGGGGIDRLNGGEGADRLTDGDEQGYLFGGAGDDSLRPGGGEDVIDGGEGVDRLLADYSNWSAGISFTLNPDVTNYLFPDSYKRMLNVEAMTFAGGSGRDHLTGADADDVLTGNAGGDVLIGGGGADRLLGGDGRDHLVGGDGDDVLDGGTASGPLEILSAGYGEWNLNTQPDLLFDLTQVNNGSIGNEPTYGFSQGFTFTVTDPETQFLSIDLGPELVSEGPHSSSYFYVSVTRVDGGQNESVWMEYYTGGPVYLGFEAFAGASYFLYIDSIDDDPAPIRVSVSLPGVPSTAGDRMEGGAGNDTYLVDGARDVVIEGARGGNDKIVTSLASYSLAALPEIERLVGDASAQSLAGNARNNVIAGGGGADRLDGGEGNDRLIVVGNAAAVIGGAGRDVLEIAEGASAVLPAGSVSGIEAVQVRDGATLNLAALTASVAPLRSLSTTGGAAQITGTKGADTIYGGAGADRLSGGGGDDHVIIYDQVAGVDGAGGSDRLSLRGSDAGVTYAFSGNALKGFELVVVDEGATLDLTGLTTAPGRILLAHGGSTVTGSDAADRIVGGRGADVIAGGLGGDSLTGGNGADRFVFRAAADSPANGERDRIVDFAASEGDRIDVSAMSPGAIAFIGGAGFSGAAASGPELRATVTANGSWNVQIDLNRDGIADAAFTVATNAPLIEANFLL